MGMAFIPELQKALHRQQHYSKILMIRTDFHWSTNTDRYRYGDKHQFSIEMSYLMLQLSEYPGVIGYTWVLEESLSRGLHAHAAIYANGQHHRNKWGFYSELQRLWRAETRGEGYVYNCVDESDYTHDIRFPVHFDDSKGRKAMRYVVNYLTKTEQKPFEPIYQISRLPDVNDKPIGRPRSRHR